MWDLNVNSSYLIRTNAVIQRQSRMTMRVILTWHRLITAKRRREICLTLEDMGYKIEASHHEMAPGQHEITFRYDDALKTADRIVTFRTVVKTIAKRNGLHATFMPKPIAGVAVAECTLQCRLKRTVKMFSIMKMIRQSFPIRHINLRQDY